MQKMGKFEEKRKKLLHIVRLRKYKIKGGEKRSRENGNSRF